MKNSKRMMAVIAATGLALGALPGVANAQDSSDLLDLGLGVALGDSLEVGLELGLGSLAPGEGTTPDFGSITEGSTGEDAPNLGSITEGSTGEDAPNLGSITEGSTGEDAPDFGSITEGSTGEDAPDFGSIIAGSTDSEGNLDLGSLSPEAGSLDNLLEEIETGSDAGSAEIRDLLEIGSSNLGSNVLVQGSAGENGSLDSEDVMTLGSIAAVSLGIGLAVQGGVNLPPLPEVNLGFVCQLPPEAIDFLKGNGSMQQDECLPEEQN